MLYSMQNKLFVGRLIKILNRQITKPVEILKYWILGEIQPRALNSLL